MKHWLSKVICALGLLGIALACVVTAPAIAKADTPDIALKNLRTIKGTAVEVSTTYLTDNYGNTYTNAISNAWKTDEIECLLDGKYSRFTGTLYVPVNADFHWGDKCGFSITADGKTIYSSPMLDLKSKPVFMDVDLKGCNDVVFGFSYASSSDRPTVCIADAGVYRVKPSDTSPINASGQNIFRMYNPYNGEHLYTVDTNEADSLLSHGWKWEDTSSVPKTGSSVYRLCNKYDGEHLYTTDFNEYKTLSSGGWNGEGQKFYSADSSGKPFYRIWNPWGAGVTAHTYTTDTNEVDTLTRDGWKSDGVCWYGIW